MATSHLLHHLCHHHLRHFQGLVACCHYGINLLLVLVSFVYCSQHLPLCVWLCNGERPCITVLYCVQLLYNPVQKYLMFAMVISACGFSSHWTSFSSVKHQLLKKLAIVAISMTPALVEMSPITIFLLLKSSSSLKWMLISLLGAHFF